MDLDIIRIEGGLLTTYMYDSGSFTEDETLTTSSVFRLDDYDGDGDLDIISSLGSSINILEFDDGFLEPVEILNNGQTWPQIKYDFIDMDGDNDLDLVVADGTIGLGTLVHSINNDGIFETPVSFYTDSENEIDEIIFLPIHANGDTYEDLAISYSAETRVIYVLESNGSWI